jgi:hypothetical protein
MTSAQPIYGTRSSANWNSTPAQFDTLNNRIVFETDSELGIPKLEPCTFVPSMLAAWHDPKQRDTAAITGGALHFFIDDYRFERVWTRPEASYERIAEVGAALSPDFSVWRDMPKAAQIWQVYRSRWLAAFWQHLSVEVIPTVTWGREDTYDFCFDGLPKNAHLAISTLGVPKDAQTLFAEGLHAMIERCEPALLLCYGKPPENLPVPVREYTTFWDAKRPPKNGKEKTC